jgi:hypothetical protein
MPFDSAEFFRDRYFAAPERGRWRLLAARLRRAFRGPGPVDEPIAPAMLRVLEEARGLIARREDWVQGDYETLGGERCAVGALRLAAEFLDYPRAGVAAHALLTGIAIGRGFTSIERMNDHSPHDEVLGAFDAAIAAARQRSTQDPRTA